MKLNKNGRRFNLLDAALVLLLVFALLGVWQRSNLQNLFTTDELLENYTVSFEIKKVRSTTVDLLQKDTALYIMNNGERVDLGTLNEQVAASAATVYLQDRNGNTVKAVYPQDAHEYLLDVTGDLTCAGVENQGSFFAAGKLHLAINQTVSVQTETADFEIRITGIQKMS